MSVGYIKHTRVGQGQQAAVPHSL